jgi:translation initiation factor IF-3
MEAVRVQRSGPMPAVFIIGQTIKEGTGITDYMINEQIRDKEVRLIDADGAQLGIVPGRDAQRIADEKRLDLVKISPTAVPPVCKIMDYSKFRFEQSKKEKEARKKQRTIDIKEVRLSPNIDKHDVEVKMKKAIEFLKDGDKVKVTIRFRGRELGRTEGGYVIMNNFAAKLSDLSNIEKPSKMEGRSMTMFLAPKPNQKE